MALIPVYRDLAAALMVGSPQPVLDQYGDYFDGLATTYGADLFGPDGVPGALARLGPSLCKALASASAFGMEERCEQLLQMVAPLLPGQPPDLYLATLFFIAPAATLSVKGRPTIALGMERFQSNPPQRAKKVWYHPHEVEEMIPHEAAHVARMQSLQLPPSPRFLSLLDMVMLEGTALCFTDLLLGRETLATFMPKKQLAWHKANDAQVRSALAPELNTIGMEPFTRYFSTGSSISGYYVGYSLCREFLDRFGTTAIPALIAMPSPEILKRLG